MTETPSEGTDPKRSWKRHRFLDYQGFAFPWYVALIWICFFILGLGYLVRFVVLG